MKKRKREDQAICIHHIHSQGPQPCPNHPEKEYYAEPEGDSSFSFVCVPPAVGACCKNGSDNGEEDRLEEENALQLEFKCIPPCQVYNKRDDEDCD